MCSPFCHCHCCPIGKVSGIPNVYEFLRDSGRYPEPAWLKEALAANFEGEYEKVGKMCYEAPKYGNDIDETTSPLEAGLGWTVKLTERDFLGKTAIATQKADGIKRKLVGFEMLDKGIARHGYPVVSTGWTMASCTSAALTPFETRSASVSSPSPGGGPSTISTRVPGPGGGEPGVQQKRQEHEQQGRNGAGGGDDLETAERDRSRIFSRRGSSGSGILRACSPVS